MISIVVTIECLLFLRGIPECSDTANYLNNPGSDSLTLLADSLLYYWLHLLGDNKLWFQLVELASIVAFNIAVILFSRDRLTSLFLALLPFLGSIIGMHLWACAIRNGISFSFLILSLAILESGKVRSTPNQTIRHKSLSFPAFHQIYSSVAAILSIMFHWSSAFVLLAVLFLSSSGFKANMHNIGKLRIGYKFCLVAISVMLLGLAFAFVFSTKIQSYALIGDPIEYGRRLPFIVLAIFFISVCLFRPWLRTRQLLRSYRSIYILAFTSLMSILSLLGFNSNLIRLLAPLQAISVLYMLLDSVYLSRSALLFGLLSLPFGAYSLITYIGAYK
jgi:hypothetical protein